MAATRPKSVLDEQRKRKPSVKHTTPAKPPAHRAPPAASPSAHEPSGAYKPGTPVAGAKKDAYGNPILPGSAGDRPINTGGAPNLNPGGDTTGGTKATPGEGDLLGQYGLPPDIAAVVHNIFVNHPGDPNGAAQEAVAYIRGTDWYAQTFPGIKEARSIGFIGTDLGSEREYKQYYNSYNAYYQQYYGRHMTADEAYRLFSTGAQPTFVGQQFAGAAYVNANKPDIQYVSGAFGSGRLSNDQLTAYGLEQAGYDTPLGAKLNTQFQAAVQRFQRVFQGVAATPNLSVGGAGLKSDSLLGNKVTPDLPA